jgi:hypothetical protein
MRLLFPAANMLFGFCGGCIYNLGNGESEKWNRIVAVERSVAREGE